MLGVDEEIYRASNVLINFQNEEECQQLSRLLVSDRLRGTVEENDYH